MLWKRSVKKLWIGSLNIYKFTPQAIVADPSEIEESEKQQVSKEKLKGSKPKQQKFIRPRTLIEAFENQSDISPGLIALLSKQYGNPVVSFYLDLTADKLLRTNKVYLSFFNSEKHNELESKKGYIENLSHSQKKVLEDDLNQIEQFLINYLVPDYFQSLVIFKSGKELNRIFTVPTRTADGLFIDIDPYLQPLETLLEKHPKLLLVHITKERAIYYIYFLGSIQEVESVKSFVPSDNVDASRPAKVQRLRRGMLDEHFKNTAAETRRLCELNQCDYLVVSGEADTVPKFEEFLEENIKNKIIDRINLPPGFDRKDLSGQLAESIAKFENNREREDLRKLKQYRREGVLVFGLPAVIKAQNQFIIKKLYIDGNLSQPGFICPDHHFLSISPGACPTCNKELVPVSDIVDELIEFSRSHKTDLMLVQKYPAMLKNYGGIAALTYKVYF